MLAETCAEKHKINPVGPAILVDGVPLQRQERMIYWYRWGRHTFDIRDARWVLGLPMEHEGDSYFSEGPYFLKPEEAFRAVVEQLLQALNGRAFADLIDHHDRNVRMASGGDASPSQTPTPVPTGPIHPALKRRPRAT